MAGAKEQTEAQKQGCWFCTGGKAAGHCQCKLDCGHPDCWWATDWSRQPIPVFKKEAA